MSQSSREWIKKARIMELSHGAMESVDEFRLHLQRVRPDGVHLIGCSHAGVMSYRSKIGPGAQDETALLERIEVARKLGIKIIGSHSGMGNKAAGDAHPEWIRVASDGKPSTQNFCGWQMDPLSPYPEEWFLPQVEEMLRDYGIDGLWVDGDCWYMFPSYSEAWLKRFREETGLEAPRIQEETKWHLSVPTAADKAVAEGSTPVVPDETDRLRKWLAFSRKVFREFQQKTGELCHRYGAVYTSNATHSVDTGPDAVPTWIDYLSADIPEFESSGCTMASLKARFNATQGVPHDVMTWDFNSRNPWGGLQTYPKGRRQLFCEVASAIANGAIWNNWTSRPHDGAAWEIADFIHKHEDILSETQSAAEIAIVHSSTSFYVHSEGLFRWKEGNKPVRGASRALQIGGHHYDIVSEANLSRFMDRYRLLILAGQTHLPEETIALLDRFMTGGGRLLVTGRSGFGDGSTTALAHILGLKPQAGKPDPSVMLEVRPEWIDEIPKPEGASLCVMAMATPREAIVPEAAEVVQHALTRRRGAERELATMTGWSWPSSRAQPDESRPFLTRNRFGEGAAWYVAAEVFGHYEKHLYFGIRHLILDVIDRILPHPLVRARGKLPVEVSLRRKNDATYVCHLVNVNVEGTNNCMETQYHRNVPTGSVEVEIRLPARPKSATLARTGQPVESEYHEGVLRCRTDSVDVMESVIIRM